VYFNAIESRDGVEQFAKKAGLTYEKALERSYRNDADSAIRAAHILPGNMDMDLKHLCGGYEPGIEQYFWKKEYL